MATHYGTTTSEEAQLLYNTLLPFFQTVYNPNQIWAAQNTGQLWETPNLADWLPDVSAYQSDINKYAVDPSQYRVDASQYTVSPNKYQQPNIQDYIAGGDQWNRAYQQIAPSYINTLTDVLDKTKTSLASGGSLGSPYAGTSGAAADALLAKYPEFVSAINKDVTTAVQDPLTKAYLSQVESGDTRYGADVGLAGTGLKAASDLAGTRYSSDVGLRKTGYEADTDLLSNAYSTTANALKSYYEQYMDQQKYPYEQYGSILTASLPTTTSTTTSDSGGK